MFGLALTINQKCGTLHLQYKQKVSVNVITWTKNNVGVVEHSYAII